MNLASGDWIMCTRLILLFPFCNTEIRENLRSTFVKTVAYIPLRTRNVHSGTQKPKAAHMQPRAQDAKNKWLGKKHRYFEENLFSSAGQMWLGGAPDCLFLTYRWLESQTHIKKKSGNIKGTLTTCSIWSQSCKALWQMCNCICKMHPWISQHRIAHRMRVTGKGPTF